MTEQYALLVPDLVQQPVSETIMDGEIIAMDKNGTQCFQCLQEYLTSRRLAEAEAGAKLADLVRKYGMSDAAGSY